MKLKIFGMAILFAGIIFSGCGEEKDSAPANKVEAQSLTAKFPQFATTNLAGETVTNEIFAQKKITVVNIWGTFCPPCIAEMPELGVLAENLPAGAQLIGIVCDAQSAADNQTLDAAKKILAEANANFPNLIPNAELGNFLQNVYAVPTTIFVDAQGNLIGEPVIGADVESYRQRVKDFLNE